MGIHEDKVDKPKNRCNIFDRCSFTHQTRRTCMLNLTKRPLNPRFYGSPMTLKGKQTLHNRISPSGTLAQRVALVTNHHLLIALISGLPQLAVEGKIRLKVTRDLFLIEGDMYAFSEESLSIATEQLHQFCKAARQLQIVVPNQFESEIEMNFGIEEVVFTETDETVKFEDLDTELRESTTRSVKFDV